jgi:hypothetical protein
MNKKYTKPLFFFFVVLSILYLFLTGKYIDLFLPGPVYAQMTNPFLMTISFIIYKFFRFLIFLTLVLITALIIGIYDKNFLKEYIDENIFVNIFKKNRILNYIIHIFILSFIFSIFAALLVILGVGIMSLIN